MICLAAIEGRLIFFAVFAVVGVINWWLEKRKLKSGPGSAQPSAPPNRPISEDSGGDSEQERLRRFLEALGVPQQPSGPPPKPVRPQPQPSRSTVVRPQARPMQPAARPVQKIFRQPAPPAVTQQPQEMPGASRTADAASSVERIAGEFGAMTVQAAMPVPQFQKPAELVTGNAGTTSVIERAANPLVASLQRILGNPTDIRAAFLASELLGPPRGLQD